MRTIYRIPAMTVAVCTALLLSACATTGTAPAGHDAAARSQIDSLYVAHVEMLADRRGVDVHWVNPPTRRAPPSK